MQSFVSPAAVARAQGSPETTSLTSSVTNLKGVAAQMALRLARLNIHTIQDLLFHLPARYQDRTRVVPIGSLRAGDEAVISGEVLLSEVRYGKRRMLLVRISDGTGSLTLRFFHFTVRQQQNLAKGAWLRCFGEIRKGAVTLEMNHPEYRFVDKEGRFDVDEYLTPVYPTTEGLGQASLRALTTQALTLLQAGTDPLAKGLREWLPEDVLSMLKLPTLKECLLYVHRPPPDASVYTLMEGSHPAQQRLAFEELLAHHLSMRQLREQVQQLKAPVIKPPRGLTDSLLSSLPFRLTAAQNRVLEQITADLQRDHPMQRLVQGDVGCGKTVVAALAALQAVESAYQVAVMAPTEILAEQHYHSFTQWLAPLGLEVAWISGKLKGKAREVVLEQLASGKVAVVVGTHALFQANVVFSRLGLMIVDEQHRFGVHQRLALREKGLGGNQHPHQLIMTATPIPRTLAMTAYADLDCSVIDELPPGREPVTTVVIPDSRRDEVLQRVYHACREGGQAYWVCTLIEESEAIQSQAAIDTAEVLAEALPELRVGLVHGRLKSAQKEAEIAAFKQGEIDLLVATTVIEVGVDVPNASLMIIENAERLGLAQLHQLRGRVGRGKIKSTCVLMFHGRLSGPGKARLAIMRDTNDGFEIARRDLELRGPGEILGTRQTGMLLFRIADLLRDQKLMPLVSRAADQLARQYPRNIQPIIERWVGESARYANV